MSTSFRPEVRALRALAVTLVVVYHLWPGILPGGYVGVDVFFVISGFLITRALHHEVQQTGRVSLPRFWARRIRRLLPAASLVLVASLLLMLAVVPRSLWQQTVTQIGASALYVQNWVLASGSVDYLAADDAPTLVQHFWSLSVEEQFYLVWPLILLVLAVLGRGRRTVLVVVGMLALASLVWSVLHSGVPSGYFDTAGRAWEFAAGGLIALVPRWRARVWFSAVGLAGILASALLYNGDTVFPGVAALLPVAGTVLVIAGGADGWSGRVAALRPVRFVGDVSYSLYLWHWPLIIAAGHLVGPVAGALIALPMAVLLAWATTRFVETPVRRRRPTRHRWQFAMAAASAVLIVLAGSATWSSVQAGVAQAQQSTEQRFASDPCYGAAALLTGCDRPFEVTSGIDTAFAVQDRGVLARPACNSFDVEVVQCEFGELVHPVATIAVIGNSHAAHLVAGLEVAAEQHDWRVILMRKTDCLGVSTIDAGGPAGKTCARWSAAVLERLVEPDIDVALFASHRDALRYLTDDDTREAELESQIAQNLATVAASTRVVVVGDVPGTRPTSAPDCVYAQRDRYDPCSTPRGDGLEDNNLVMRAAPAERVSLLSAVCDAERCHAVVGGVVVYFDDHHLSASFSRSLAPVLGAAVERSLRG